jgi:hypothetical protein
VDLLPIHVPLHPKPATPFAQLGDQQTQALQQLARLSDAAIDNNPPSNKIAPCQLPRVDRSPLRVAAPCPAQGPLAPHPAPRVAVTQNPKQYILPQNKRQQQNLIIRISHKLISSCSTIVLTFPLPSSLTSSSAT